MKLSNSVIKSFLEGITSEAKGDFVTITAHEKIYYDGVGFNLQTGTYSILKCGSWNGAILCRKLDLAFFYERMWPLANRGTSYRLLPAPDELMDTLDDNLIMAMECVAVVQSHIRFNLKTGEWRID